MRLSWHNAPGKAAKRLVDVGAAGLGLALLSPVLLALALIVKMDDPGPAFFRQERVGRGGVPFRIWKLRTMVTGSESGVGVTAADDTRITRFGKWLRRHKLDELPQLLNVLGGSMSLVGPRPELPRYVALYTDEEREALDYRPGITDPAALEYLDEEAVLSRMEEPERYYREVLMREKVRVNLAYARDATLSGDVRVILATVSALLRRRSG